MEMKPLPEKSLNVFCDIFDFSKGQADITCPADTYPTACLRACERRGLIQWDTERVKGKTKRWCALTAKGAKIGCEEMALAHVPLGTSAPRKRLWVKVQFDVNQADYAEAYQIAGELAEQSLLAPTVADLLRIHKAAESGDYRLFYELYGIPETKETEQFQAMFSVMDRMQNTIEELTEKIKAQNTPQAPVGTPPRDLQAGSGSTQASGGIRAIGGIQSVPMPTFDDELDEDLLDVQVDSGAGKRASENFLKSLMSLQE